MSKKTQTSSFGTSKREGHDSSPFYSRSLFETNGSTNGVFHLPTPLSDNQINQIKIPELGDWVDKIYCGTSERLEEIPSNSIGLAFTSPPYNVGKDYDDDLGLDSYIELIRNVGKEVYRVLRPGGRYVINVANLGRKPYIPLNAIFFHLHMELSFLPMGEIIWQKAKGAGNSTAWGSWMSAKSPRLRDVHEYLLVFAKQSFSRPDRRTDELGPNEFLKRTISIWDIQPESAQKVGHPAPFPIELAENVIALYSYEGDVVLDPFVGSGSTCVAAIMNKRHYIGYDISPEYCEIARARIKNIGRTYLAGSKTEATELSVAFGILQINNPSDIHFTKVDKFFGGSLNRRKFHTFKTELNNPKNENLYKELIEVGQRIRKNYSHFENTNSLIWRGEKKQTLPIPVTQDLSVNGILVSVKAQSNLILNTSPNNVFIQLPQGRPKAIRGENWYLQTAPIEYQKLYNYIKTARGLSHFPETVEALEKGTTTSQRKELKQAISLLTLEQQSEFEELYLQMCHKVALISADKFNKHFCESKSNSNEFRGAVLESIARELFRLDTTEYILAGVDRNQRFAVLIPALSDWRQLWMIDDVEAEPDLAKGQSIVNLNVEIRNNDLNKRFKLRFQAQIRWSHGKFGGFPEAKLYKDFRWDEVDFFKSLV